ncbi:MAG: hypothetical protein NTY46_03185 [Candidatus Sumerlaeota bacterium]|nr:hypothetical protein [Candidatus Sumerlaeota bacterium]
MELKTYLSRTFELLRREWPLALLIAASLILQTLFYSASVPNVFPDSSSYQLLAEAIMKGDWGHVGFVFRTPGYPVFLAIINWCFGLKNWNAVMTIQFLCGSLIPILLYAIYYTITSSRLLAAVGACGFLLDRYSLGLQTVPLSEFMGGFTVILALAGYLWFVRKKAWWSAIVVGLLFFINLIIRPSFQMLFVCAAVGGLGIELLYYEGRLRWRRALIWYGIFVLTTPAGIWGWSLVIYRNTGVFGLSHQLGASMTNQTGTMMELAPDEYASIRDMYVKERDLNKGDHINLFDHIGWKIADANKITMWQLSLKFNEINKYLTTHYPGRYLGQVRYAWHRLWTDDSRYQTDITDPDGSGTGKFEPTPLFRYIATSPMLKNVYAPIDSHLWDNVALLAWMPWIIMLLTVAAIFIVRRNCRAVLGIAMVVGTAMYHMLLHAMVQFTEFGRYKMPIQALWFSYVIMAISLICNQIWIILRRRFGETTIRQTRQNKQDFQRVKSRSTQNAKRSKTSKMR